MPRLTPSTATIGARSGIAFSDFAYREGSIYGAVEQQTFLISLTMLLTGILRMGLLRREKRGTANIAFKSFLINLYVTCFALIALAG